MPRKLSTKINSLSKYDNVILNIIGDNGATFEHIRAKLRAKDVLVSCLEGLVSRLVVKGMLKEDDYGMYRKRESSRNVIKCLGCGKFFKSEGIHNRMCKTCKRKS